MRSFRDLGFDTITVSGEPGSDRVVQGIGLTPSGRPVLEIAAELDEALGDADIVVVENLLTIPMNLDASAAAEKVLVGRRVLVHHHDPPWHRERFAHVTALPVDSPGWLHVSINRVLQQELADRGIASTLIYNGFEVPDPVALADREVVRSEVRVDLGVQPDELLVAHPVRAIERKNIPEALRLCEALGATYWLLGPPEEDYASELERLFAQAECRTINVSRPSQFEIYAACDHVTFPSTWEGFGNPPIEASLHRRTVSVGRYPVSAELRALGFMWLDSDDPDAVRATLDAVDSPAVKAIIDNNEVIARRHFSFETMTEALKSLLSSAGWLM